jgi:hypothetical protein
VHRKKSNGEIFYVGKGHGDRFKTNKGRSQHWHRVVNKYGVICEIVKDNLLEWYALEFEKELILKHGRLDLNEGLLINKTDGGEGKSGYKITQDQRKNLSDALRSSEKVRAYGDRMSIPLIMDEDDTKVFPSARACSKYLKELYGINTEPIIHVAEVCNVKSHGYKGHMFRWLKTDKEQFYKDHLLYKERVSKLIGDSARRSVKSRCNQIIMDDSFLFESLEDAANFLVEVCLTKSYQSARTGIKCVCSGKYPHAFKHTFSYQKRHKD